MSKFVKNHLKDISVEDLEDFKSIAFMPMAFISGRAGNYAIGISGNGLYAVKINDEIKEYENPHDAIGIYRLALNASENN
jgi:hypothetical protein